MTEQLEIAETQSALAHQLPTEEEIVAAGKIYESYPQIPCPLEHFFSPGKYRRRIFMPAGTRVIGHAHKGEHDNYISQGRLQVLSEGKVFEIVAPYRFRSGAGARKVLNIIEDTYWETEHENPSEERDIEKLETMISDKYDAPLPLSEQQLRLPGVESKGIES